MPTSLDNGRRSPRKLLRAVVARLRRRGPTLSEHGLPPGFEPIPPGPVRTTKLYQIDGENFSNLEEFFEEVERVFAPDISVRDLEGVDDMLIHNWPVLPHEGFTLRWMNHELSRERLSYAETARLLEKWLEHCDPNARVSLEQQIAAARAHEGPTVFDWLVETIRDHGPGGEHEEDDVRLELA